MWIVYDKGEQQDLSEIQCRAEFVSRPTQLRYSDLLSAAAALHYHLSFVHALFNLLSPCLR